MKSPEKSPVLSVVLPAYNEAAIIRDVVTDYFCEVTSKIPSTLLVAEDGSTDGTRDILFSLKKEIPISLSSSPKRKGFAKGVSDALKKCNEEWVFFSDSDGQYFPSDFWKLWGNRHGYDMIIGHKTNRGDAFYRIVMSKAFHAVVSRLFGLKLKDVDCGFRLIRKDVIRSVLNQTRVLKYSFWTEFTVRACLKGFKVKEVPINHACRNNGGTRIYKPSKIPTILFEQLRGLVTLYSSADRALRTNEKFLD